MDLFREEKADKIAPLKCFPGEYFAPLLLHSKESLHVLRYSGHGEGMDRIIRCVATSLLLPRTDVDTRIPAPVQDSSCLRKGVVKTDSALSRQFILRPSLTPVFRPATIFKIFGSHSLNKFLVRRLPRAKYPPVS